MKSFFRFLKRNPYYTVINIAGLAVALMFVILIGDYSWRQFRVDAGQPNKDRIVILSDPSSFYSWPEVSHEIGESYPEIEKTCCVISTAGTVRAENGRLLDDEEHPTILLADSTFFDFFQYRFKEGDVTAAFDSPEKCVITESLSRQLFPDENAVGMPVRVIGKRSIFIKRDGMADPYDSTLVYTVGGVIHDLDNTVLPNDTKIILPFRRHPQILGYRLFNDSYVSSQFGYCKTLFLLGEGAELDSKAEAISSRINSKVVRFGTDEPEAQYSFTPLRKVMFAPQNDGDGLEKGDKELLTVLLSAIIAILLFAVTNYINLTVANTGMRAREMATRRLLGTNKSGIILKLIGESVLMVAISFLIGLALAFAFQNNLATMFKGKILLERDISLGTVSVSFAFILATGILAGLIPGLQISSYKPVDVVKGSFRYKSKMIFSRIFIMLQNFITVVMLTASLVIVMQINYLINAPLGVNTENIVVVSPDRGEDAVVRDAIGKLPCVRKIGTTRGTSLVTYSSSMYMMPDKDDKKHIIYSAEMDKEALEIYGLEILKDYGVAPGTPFFNEEFCRIYSVGEDDREVYYASGYKPDAIGGIIRDFHQGNILTPVYPFRIVFKETSDLANPNFVILTDGSAGAKKIISDAVAEVVEDASEMEWTVMMSEVGNSFGEQRELLRIVLMFTIIAVIISILGFIGISLFFIRQRRSEIAVRRIMGGSVSEVIMLLLVKFCSPLLVSVLAAVPVAYWIMDKWLQDFSYRMSLSAWIFIATALASILIALLSVLWQTVIAVRTNPADSIKTE